MRRPSDGADWHRRERLWLSDWLDADDAECPRCGSEGELIVTVATARAIRGRRRATGNPVPLLSASFACKRCGLRLVTETREEVK